MNTTYRFGHVEVRPAQRELLANGTVVALGARAFDTLVALIERRDRVVGVDELFALVWPGVVVEENNLRQQVSALRKALGAAAIRTVPGRGYQFTLDERPAPSAADAQPALVPNHNLPANLPPLLGREAEFTAVSDLLRQCHLLTLVGAGGVGKTRFAIEVASTLAADYPDGVWLVELAPVADPALVPRTVAAVLGVHDEPGRPLLDTLVDALRHRRMLLLLDNCEHLIESCARWAAQLLRACSGVRTLATSREALNVEGETAWRMPSLRTAAPSQASTPEQLMEYPATRLFVQRAGAVSSGFRLTGQNAAAVAHICHQLDGIPLALELAAARIRALRAEQLAERLGDRFALLTHGSRSALPRHQTLRGMIDWSHDLLDEPERALLRRLAVFAGGWTLEAAEAVCSDARVPRASVLELLSRLVERSLVQTDEASAEPRYAMLETIRQYAAGKLEGSGEADTMRLRHLEHLVAFTEPIRSALMYDDRNRRWNALVQADLDNIRAALGFAAASGHAGLGLQLFCALHRFWYENMHWKEAVGIFERLVARCADGGPDALWHARALYIAAMQATNYDPAAGRRLCDQGFALSQSTGFDEGMAWSLMWSGYIDTRRRDPATADLFTRCLVHGRRIGDPWRRAMFLAQALICQAGYEAVMGHDERVEALVRECEIENAKAGGILLFHGHCLALLGTLATRRGKLELAGGLLAESLAAYRTVESKFDIAGSLVQQGFLALRRDEPARALSLFREGLPMYRAYPTSPWVTRGLAHLVIAYAACGRWSKAARLAGVLNVGEGQDRAPPELSGRAAGDFVGALERTRAAVGADAFDDALRDGRGMTREQAIAFALVD